MEIEIIKKEARREYPYVGKYKGSKLEIIFIGQGSGYVSADGETWGIGHYGTNWVEDDFIPIHNGRLIQTKDKITFEVE